MSAIGCLKISFLFSLSFFVSFGGVQAASEEKEVIVDPVLVLLMDRLEEELEDLEPAPTAEVPDGYGGKSLVFRYKTKINKVFPRNKARREGGKLIEVEGPETDGVLLRVHVQKKGEVNQAVVPQVLRQHHWSTFLNVHPVSGTDRQIYIALAYGKETDKDLVKKIKAVLAAVEKPARS